MLTHCASEQVRNFLNMFWKIQFFNKNPCVSEGEKCDMTSQSSNKKDNYCRT